MASLFTGQIDALSEEPLPHCGKCTTTVTHHGKEVAGKIRTADRGPRLGIPAPALLLLAVRDSGTWSRCGEDAPAARRNPLATGLAEGRPTGRDLLAARFGVGRRSVCVGKHKGAPKF